MKEFLMSLSMPPKIKPYTELVVATHNTGKLQEIRSLLEPYTVTVHSAAELNLPEPEETGTSFHENAQLKAIAAAKASGLMALADDSGFCLDGLNGAPGLYSARWAGPDKNYQKAMETMHEKLLPTHNFAAHFTCVLNLALPDGKDFEFEGKIEGEFVWPPRGHHGHGYDPVFQPKNFKTTFAEMTEAEKNKISHRALAFQKFIKACF